MSPASIIQKQVDAYNARNIDSFVACHSHQVRLFTFGESKPFCDNIQHLREIYRDIFDNSPELHSQIINRIEMGDTIIDHELISGRKGVEPFEMFAIYEVEHGLIIRAYFKRKVI